MWGALVRTQGAGVWCLLQLLLLLLTPGAAAEAHVHIGSGNALFPFYDAETLCFQSSAVSEALEELFEFDDEKMQWWGGVDKQG